ncbi:MAG: HAD family hydrolase [Candidatus Thermoplasmatota archaeon]|jgi:phosphoserine phosphatase|nr:HAD family hydrolase [Candidatus Thermoplasmatota archaeon]
MIEIEELKNGINKNQNIDYLENIKLMVFDMDGVLLKNRNSWDVIIHRSMNKRYSGPGMKYTFDYVYRNGVPEHLYENLTETKIRTYLNLNDVSSNVLRTIEYLKDRKIKTAIVSAGSKVFAGYLADLIGIDYHIGNEVDSTNHRFIKNVDPVKKDANVMDIQAKYGISPEETVSVGDSYMDLSMRRKSKYFVAFNPATSRLIGASDFIVDSTNLYDIIEQMTGQ